VEAASPIPKSDGVSINALYRSPGRSLQVQRGPEDAQAVLVELDQLATGRYQKRAITPDRVRQLAETIRQNGLLQPVTARPVGDGFELIAGHRRRDAFKLLRDEAKTDEERAKWSKVPCIIRLGLSEVQAAALAAVENLERDDGDPLEQGLSLLEVKKAGSFTSNGQVATATGMNVQRVTRLIRLAESPEVIQAAVSPGMLVEVVEKDGTAKKQRKKLDLTVALAAYSYFHHWERASGQEVACERTEKLLLRAAKGEWTRARLESEIKRITPSRDDTASYGAADASSSDSEDGASDETPAPDGAAKRVLYRDRGAQWVLYPQNIERAPKAELHELLERLNAFVATVQQHLSRT
jgi:ParB/RepB/Spo0J family partition protein